MEVVKKNILKSRNIKDISAKIYTNDINRLHTSIYGKDLINLEFLYNFDEIIKHLENFKLSVKKNILSAIVVALSCKEKHTDLHSKYFIILEKCIQEYKNRKKEKINTTIRDLDSCLKKLKKILNNNNYFDENVLNITDFDRQILNRYLIGCLYVYFPPRLSKDYLNMEVISYDEFNELDNIDKNYLVIINKHQKFFSFCKKNKTHEIKINKKFNEVLNLYLKFHKNKLFIPYKNKLNTSTIISYLKDCFVKHNITFTKLRKIYINEKVLPLSFGKALSVVKEMGYTESSVRNILYQNDKTN